MTESIDAAAPEVVIIGAGIAGGALATVLARAGIEVLLLERSLEHKDVVRGEWLAPWGVTEAKALGLYELYRAAGGHHVKRHITYGQEMSAAEAEARAHDLTVLLPDNEGPLCLGHPAMCNLLDAAAASAGARMLRGVKRTRVQPGERPTIAFEHDGIQHRLRPRLVVAADGRNGGTREALGIPLHADPQHHWFSGLLVDDVHGWPADLQCIATENDLHALIFPQSDTRVRLYLGFATEQRGRFAGHAGPQQFLEAFALPSIPRVDAIVQGRPAGPSNVYPNNDTWAEALALPGVLLIGDAAGRNDPITGQGLSISHRDVRIVRDLLLASRDWTPATFSPYCSERVERMRRLRFSAAMTSVRDAEFGAAANAKRHRLRVAGDADPMLMAAVFSALVGPEALPAEAFSATAWAAFMAV